MLKLNTGEFLRIKKNNSRNHDDGEIVLSWYVHIYLFNFCRKMDTWYTLRLARVETSSIVNRAISTQFF